MAASIWSDNLAEFRDKTGGTNPVPAAVSVSAVTASLALALLIKVLEITRKRKSFSGDPAPIARLIEAATRESAHLARLADDDIDAFNRYLECVRNKLPAGDAMREATQVPLEAARAAVRGLTLCMEATQLCSERLTSSDLGAAAALLSGAAKAMLLSVESNLRHIASDDNA
jgi:methenyltetrahydrofolate cyclohydrolase